MFYIEFYHSEGQLREEARLEREIELERRELQNLEQQPCTPEQAKINLIKLDNIYNRLAGKKT